MVNAPPSPRQNTTVLPFLGSDIFFYIFCFKSKYLIRCKYDFLFQTSTKN